MPARQQSVAHSIGAMCLIQSLVAGVKIRTSTGNFAGACGMNFSQGGYVHTRDTEGTATRLLDEAIETLRWCRQHLQERKASEELRQLESKLGYLSMALSWEADGEPAKADVALGVANGRSRRQQRIDQQVWEDMFWAH
jgi:hypothetical protein